MSRVIRTAVSKRRDLDYVWLPSEHLGKVHRGEEPTFARSDFRGSEVHGPDSVRELSLVVAGKGAQGVLGDLHRNSARYALSVSRLGGAIHDGGESVDEFVNHRALFVAKGSSFALHQEIVAEVVRRYRRLVEAAEGVALGFRPMSHEADEDGGVQMVGGPIELRLSRPVPSVPRLVHALLSAREPFRLWGIPDFQGDSYAVIDAVDLHVASQLRLEVGSQMVRVHLRRGGCGNSIARLITNLQHHVDGQISALDGRIQDALEGRAAPAAA